MVYSIAGHSVEIVHDTAELDVLLPSFIPFKADGDGGEPMLLRLVVDDSLKKEKEEHCRLIRDVDTGNGFTRVDRLHSGDYQFLVRDIHGMACALLRAEERFGQCRVALRGNLGTRRFALNNALMLAYAFSSAYYDTLLVHASVVRHRGKAYAFTAKSGTGKSTHVANWMRYIDGCDIINDDNPIIRMIDDSPVLYGSPWSGKTPCYRNIKADLGGVVLIERDGKNWVEELRPINAFSVMLTACSAMKWDEGLYRMVCDTCSRIVENAQVVKLHCLPDRQSAEVCCAYLEK